MHGLLPCRTGPPRTGPSKRPTQVDAMPTNRWNQPVGPTVDGWLGCPPPTRTSLQGRHVQLEPLSSKAHSEALFSAFDDPDDAPAWTYMGYGPFTAAHQLREWAQWAESGDDPLFFAWMVDDRAVGFASLMRAVPAHGSIEIGHVALAPRLRRTRAATEGFFLLMAHCFDTLGYRRLEWKCDALNAPSRVAADRLGFTYEGTFQAHLVIKGRRRDTAWFAMTDETWPVVRAGFVRWLSDDNFVDGQQLLGLRACREPLSAP